MGHAPVSGLIDAAAGSRNAIAECLTNLIWAPLDKGIKSVSLSANWMWPCRYEGEDARLYSAVEAVSDFAIALGINVPTGKDSLSMAQKYGDKTVLAPGTVVISSAAHCNDITKIVEPVLQVDKGAIYYIDMSNDVLKLGGSSFAQTRAAIGDKAPDIFNATEFARKFQVIQNAIKLNMISAGHDISAGGIITTLLEMCFADPKIGVNVDLSGVGDGDFIKTLFAENAGVIIQANDDKLESYLGQEEIKFVKLGAVTSVPKIELGYDGQNDTLDIAHYRDIWYESSFLLDSKQTANGLAKERYDNYKVQPLTYTFPQNWSGQLPCRDAISHRPKAAILREKGSNSEREMANALYQAGFEVKDVHMTDLISGRETLQDIQFLGAVGGFSNSDVLGSAKGWAGAIKYNDKARKAIMDFFQREDTLSIGICNGCQLFLELDLINPEQANDQPSRMTYNDSKKHESSFTSVTIKENTSVMLSSLAGSTLGVWISHGEGKFSLPKSEDEYNVVAKYGYDSYPSNPNGSDYNVAMLSSTDGRHLATMPHIERSFYAWNWAHYPSDKADKVSPWGEAFVNARKWCEK
jgi:phosphoribosylformylglycinamidine synthase